MRTRIQELAEMEKQLFTVKELADYFDVALNTIYKKIIRYNIVPFNNSSKNKYYQIDPFIEIYTDILIKYYPIKTTETFYIYQSKMNIL